MRARKYLGTVLAFIICVAIIEALTGFRSGRGVLAGLIILTGWCVIDEITKTPSASESEERSDDA